VAEFINPFTGVVPGRKLTLRELCRALRMTLAAEEEAVHLYEAIADVAGNELAKAVLQDIANEERVHAGEFQRVLSILLPDEDKWLGDGAAEVNELAETLGREQPPASEGGEVPTVGDLKE
jgi:rubrerythrin